MASLIRFSVFFMCYIFAFGGGNVQSRGRRFILPNVDVFNDTNTTLIVSTSSLASLNVEIITQGRVFQEMVSYGQPATVILSTDDNDSDEKSDTRLVVNCTGEVTLVAFIEDSFGNTDSFLVLPVDSLSDEYFLPTWDTKSAVISIASVSDGDTIIAVARTETIGILELNGKVYGEKSIFTHTIKANETVFFNSTGNVAGTLIIASEPVAIVICSDVTSSQNASLWAEMLLPFDSWDTTFLVVPLGLTSSYYDKYGIVAGLPGATVVISGANNTMYEMEYQDFIILNSTDTVPCFINSSEPIFVSQHSDSNDTSAFTQTIMGLSHWTTSYTISPPPGTSSNFVTIIATTSSTDSIFTSDQLLADANWTTVAGSNYSFITANYTGNFIYIGSVNCSEPFGVYAYGYLGNQSTVFYGHPAGMRLFVGGTVVSGNETSCDNPVFDLLPSTDSSVSLTESTVFESESFMVDTASMMSSEVFGIVSTTEGTGISDIYITPTHDPSMYLSPSTAFVQTPSLTSESPGCSTPKESLLVPSESELLHTTRADSTMPMTGLLDITFSSEYRHGQSGTQSSFPETFIYSLSNIQSSSSSITDLQDGFGLSSFSVKGDSTQTSSQGHIATTSMSQDTELSSSHQTSPHSVTDTSFPPPISAPLISSFHELLDTSVHFSSYTWLHSDISSEELESSTTAAYPELDSRESLQALYTLVAAIAAVPVFAVVLAFGLWVGITKCRSSAKFSLESGVNDNITKVSKVNRSKVRRIVVTPHNSPSLPARASLVKKQTTVTSLRSQQNLDF